MEEWRRLSVACGMLVALLCLLAAPPAAFAMVLRPMLDSGPVPTTLVTTSGMAGWEIALVSVASALFAAAATSIVMRFRFRPTLRPATS